MTRSLLRLKIDHLLTPREAAPRDAIITGQQPCRLT